MVAVIQRHTGHRGKREEEGLKEEGRKRKRKRKEDRDKGIKVMDDGK